MNLEKIRKKIDHIDHEILRLLNERIELGLRTKKFKESICDRERETQILEKLKKYSKAYSVIQSDFIEKLFTAIMRENRESQKAKRTLIGFQGEHGAFSEVAARYYDSNLAAIPCTEFADVFEGVEKGNLDLGIVPVENSLGGAVTQVNELLIKTDLKVVGAVKLRINHCLLDLPETNYREIRVVFSHPQALSQCREFLNRHHMEAQPFYDTAGAAKMLSKEKPKMAAVITSKLCAELYNLEIIKENIQDHQSNYTRFLILAREKQVKSADKCSIIFITHHKAGTLFVVLKIFAEARINLTRIESFPYRDDPGNYVFFLDFQSKEINSKVEKILRKVKQKTVMLKYLGCYREEVFE
jgi:prephenate dehydratase/chorismate mutase/prephenate dehydratase